ncbi:unnamed protein product [Cylicocyclus nassatus]|uniref:Uncharacterized protein n=1 Tax=Cylicocyclus nassatus TaxID=53992 RepID=A0AA36HBG3_CYLNA|nr:unnamed protein product [Cylicocyclus nassatus]CAJ0607201.1 unnamed protein product [Cylicocyclus nassatus]
MGSRDFWPTNIIPTTMWMREFILAILFAAATAESYPRELTIEEDRNGKWYWICTREKPGGIKKCRDPERWCISCETMKDERWKKYCVLCEIPERYWEK